MGRYEFTSEQRAVLEGLSHPLAIYQFIDKRVVTLILSDGFCELFGYDDRAQAYFDMDNDMYKDAHPDDVARIADEALRFATEGGTYEAIYRTRNRIGGGYRIVHAMGKHVKAEDGTRLAHVWYTDEGVYTGDGVYTGEGEGMKLGRAYDDVLHEESLVHASNYDYLTGLPSMTYFFELADEGKKAILERGGEPALLYMDLSGMKYFNTQNSFVEGDKMLREFAKVLKATFGSESCCRIGADHFAAFAFTDGLEGKLGRFFRDCEDINGGNNLPVRVGIYPHHIGDVPVSTACDRAKFACDSLANTYESCFGYYDSGLRHDDERRRYVLSNIDRAIEEHWIKVYYQPIIRAVTGKVCDVEALSRWTDPELGMLSPADFIPVLEDAGTIYKLDLYVLDQVLEKMRAEADMGLNVVPHSVNLSRSDFDSCDIVDEVLKRVDAAGFARDKITIEITESIIGDSEFIRRQVERFRSLGFPVWMDDFGSGYSSLDLLQSMKFDLVKFDMSFMRQFDEGDDAKILLTELMRMVTALGFDTLCEGVETEGQVKFLQEIGCAKLQGFFFSRPFPFESVIERYEKGTQIVYENPDEAPYYEAIGGVNLYDLAVIAQDDDEFRNYFDTLPMAVMEVDGDKAEFVRTNKSYRSFMRHFFGFDLDEKAAGYEASPYGPGSEFMQLVRKCCQEGNRSFFDETMPDGSTVHSFARRIGSNPMTGKSAVAIAVLSIAEPNEGATYASIARALAADYYRIFCVDLDTERFIEYSSQAGDEKLAMERHGENFFELARSDARDVVYEEDCEQFLARFTKDGIVRELDCQGAFAATYRQVEDGEPLYASMKITRMRPGANQIIIGISIIDSQIKQQELFDKMRREQDVLKRVMALSGNYLSMYSIDPDTGHYFEYSAKSEFESLGYAKEGDDFFAQGVIDAQSAIHPDDLPGFLEWFTEENIMELLRDNPGCSHEYRLMMHDEPVQVSLKIARVIENGRDKLIAGIRPWRERASDREAQT